MAAALDFLIDPPSPSIDDILATSDFVQKDNEVLSKIKDRASLTGFSKFKGHAWMVKLGNEWFDEADYGTSPQRSRLVLFENGKPLGPAHAVHQDIAKVGQGRFSHWLENLIFATSDNSDPNMNGRHYEIGLQLAPIKSPYPSTMHLNLTSACNLTCTICRPEDYKKHNVSKDLADEHVEHIIQEVFPHLRALRIDSSGEPTMARSFPRVIEAANKINLPVSLQTNGTFLREDMVDLLINSSVRSICISLDSADKKTLEFIRTGANYDRILSGVQRLADARRRAGKEKDLSLQFHGAILLQNVDHILGLLNLAKSMNINGVSLALGFTQSFMNPDWSIWWNRPKMNNVLDEATLAAKKMGLMFNPPNKFDLTLDPFIDTYKDMPIDENKTCTYLYDWSYIHPAGSVLPCCVADNYSLGSLKETSFKEIWDGPAYEELRLTHTTNESTYEKCKNCSLRAAWQPNDYKALFASNHWSYVEKKMKEKIAAGEFR